MLGPDKRTEVDLERAERGITEFLRGLGYEPSAHPELRQTARRVAETWRDDLLAGDSVDVAQVLRAGSSETEMGDKGVVVLRDLATVTVCPHHLMPAVGTATVIYLPGDRVAGLGAIARAVDALTHRLVLQEEVGEQIARALVDHLGARGAVCRLSLVHTCLVARGERKHDAHVETLALWGSVTHPGPDRELAMAALRTS